MIYNIDGDGRVNATITDQESVLVAIHHNGEIINLEIEAYELSHMLGRIRRGNSGRVFYDAEKMIEDYEVEKALNEKEENEKKDMGNEA